MSWLRDHGYQIISLGQAVGLLSGRSADRVGARDSKYAVITFDDGFEDVYTDAFPILARYESTATLFLPTAFISDTNTTVMDRRFLSWSQVRDLIKAGITVGSHTVTHKYLAELSRSQGEDEIRRSKETIEDRTGAPVDTFSVPYAFPENDKDFISFMRKTLHACGYSCAVTTKIGIAVRGDDLFALRRIPMNGDDDSRLLHAKMAGGYDWLHTVQYMAKTLRGITGIKRRRSFEKWASRY
ncbi:MAG: polysaccharide deacetylase family protein [Nitrospirota bacterium]